ncbi:hypothetical protein [Corynebacterium cystitidis]|uniref:hypothetical protein n=1 Tax=Corynebacterium cystitidis TaxID=35757 RepID=UPI00211E1EDB|nr:hypothetical protein [Corynebacterium cystitidis]
MASLRKFAPIIAIIALLVLVAIGGAALANNNQAPNVPEEAAHITLNPGASTDGEESTTSENSEPDNPDDSSDPANPANKDGGNSGDEQGFHDEHHAPAPPPPPAPAPAHAPAPQQQYIPPAPAPVYTQPYIPAPQFDDDDWDDWDDWDDDWDDWDDWDDD